MMKTSTANSSIDCIESNTLLNCLEFTYHGIPYLMYYMPDKMTEEQARIEAEFVGWGGGHDYNLFPYYIIIDKKKKDIMERIRNNIYEDGYKAGIQMLN